MDISIWRLFITKRRHYLIRVQLQIIPSLLLLLLLQEVYGLILVLIVIMQQDRECDTLVFALQLDIKWLLLRIT
ncbi:hypothetical protein BDF22DRAFT_665775, partial [Syncephalis plumigaleata]